MIFAAKHAHGAQKHLIPHWMIHLGVFGVFGISAIDSSPVPLPVPGSTDLLILLFAANHANPWLLAIAGVGGSLVGGYLTWKAGESGGEPILEHYVPKKHLKRITGWVKGHGILSVCIAALLPPPIPLMPFLVAAGALGVTRKQLLGALGIARTCRYGAEAALGVLYGRQIIKWWSKYLSRYSSVILWCFLALLVGGVAFGFWKYKRDKKSFAQKSQSGAASKAEASAA